MRDPVPLVLELLDVAHDLLALLREAVEQVDHLLGDRDVVPRSAVVEIEELALLGNETQAGH